MARFPKRALSSSTFAVTALTVILCGAYVMVRNQQTIGCKLLRALAFRRRWHR